MPVSLTLSIDPMDTLQFGLPGTGTACHICGERRTLIDTGTSHAVTRIKEQLGPHAPQFIFLTHIHPDHARGATLLSQAYPQAIIGVHEQGVKHLIDPSRVNASVRALTGQLANLYGQVFPLSSKRIAVLKHGERLILGKKSLSR